MGILESLDRFGDYWRVSIPVTASLDIPLVTPEGYLAGPENIGGIPSVNRRDGITVLGVAASVVAGAGGAATVTLRSVDPAYLEGQTVNYDIWQLACIASGSAQQALDNCALTLSPANTRVSPGTTGATLQLVTNANASSGFITVWGVYGQAEIGNAKSFSGSPAGY